MGPRVLKGPRLMGSRGVWVGPSGLGPSGVGTREEVKGARQRHPAVGAQEGGLQGVALRGEGLWAQVGGPWG